MHQASTKNTVNQQLTLAVQLNAQSSFDEFCWGKNLLLHDQLKQLMDSKENNPILFLWGEEGCGKSHLLQACCQDSKKINAFYLPLKQLLEMGPEVLDDLDENALFCIDDIDAIANQPQWETALFHLYNRVRDSDEGRLLISATKIPRRCGIALPDLLSRLEWGLTIQIQDLSDDDKATTLSAHAKKRGFMLPEPVAHYLVTRYSRNMHHLHDLLNTLDHASLVAQRKITIPFVKTVIAQQGNHSL